MQFYYSWTLFPVITRGTGMPITGHLGLWPERLTRPHRTEHTITRMDPSLLNSSCLDIRLDLVNLLNIVEILNPTI